MVRYTTMNPKPLNILIVNTDWRNIFENGFDELYKKLERDQLRPDLNNFFFFSWGTVSYVKKRDERFSSVHMKTIWRSFKPCIDFLSIVMVPYTVKKSGFKPDVIFIYDLGFVVPARILKWMYGSTVVFCMTNMPEVYSRTRRFGKIKAFYSSILEHLFVRMVDIGYTINETMKKYIMNIGIDEQKVVVFASDTINRDMVHLKASKKGIVRRRYAIKDNSKIILSIGRLEAEKGFPRLLNIFAQLDPSFTFIILGQGSLKNELQEQVKRLGLTERVFFTGFVDRTEIWDYYHDADLFMLLSNAEALGLVFWEAMYMGVPAIGSTAEGIVESLGQHGERGLIVEPDESIDSIKEKIKFILTESDKRNIMLAQAKHYVEKEIANTVTINDLHQ